MHSFIHSPGIDWGTPSNLQGPQFTAALSEQAGGPLRFVHSVCRSWRGVETRRGVRRLAGYQHHPGSWREQVEPMDIWDGVLLPPSLPVCLTRG